MKCFWPSGPLYNIYYKTPCLPTFASLSIHSELDNKVAVLLRQIQVWHASTLYVRMKWMHSHVKRGSPLQRLQVVCFFAVLGLKRSHRLDIVLHPQPPWSYVKPCFVYLVTRARLTETGRERDGSFFGNNYIFSQVILSPISIDHMN